MLVSKSRVVILLKVPEGVEFNATQASGGERSALRGAMILGVQALDWICSKMTGDGCGVRSSRLRIGRRLCVRMSKVTQL